MYSQRAHRSLTVCVQCTLAGIEKLLQRSAGYDVQQLLSGAKPSLSALTSAYSNCPGWMFGSVEPAAAAAADRQVAAAALADAVKVRYWRILSCHSGLLYDCGLC
jgi:hypothetical protein